MAERVRFRVEPSPSGGYFVRIEGHDAPVSRHDTEEDAEAKVQAYGLGLAGAAGRSAGGDPRAGESVTLKDGSDVVIRPVEPDDKPLFIAGFERFGKESRYSRFMGFKKRLSESELEFFTEVDHRSHEALGAIDPQTGEGLAVARYLRLLNRPHVAEAAVAVVDAWQSRGLGRALLERLAERASQEGISHFSASLFTGNRAMLSLFDRLGDMQVRRDEPEVAEIDVSLSIADGAGLGEALRAAASGDVGTDEHEAAQR